MSVTTLTMTSYPGATASSPLRQAGRFWRTPKAWLLLAFAPLLVLGARAEGWHATLPHVLFAVVGACLVELMAVALKDRALRWPTSALLSGLIVAFVLGPETPPTITLVVGVLATASKYLVATRRGHIFNPAALALWVSVVLAGTDQSWWGALP